MTLRDVRDGRRSRGPCHFFALRPGEGSPIDSDGRGATAAAASSSAPRRCGAAGQIGSGGHGGSDPGDSAGGAAPSGARRCGASGQGGGWTLNGGGLPGACVSEAGADSGRSCGTGQDGGPDGVGRSTDIALPLRVAAIGCRSYNGRQTDPARRSVLTGMPLKLTRGGKRGVSGGCASARGSARGSQADASPCGSRS
jgi:hypothetical protein